MNKQEAIEIIEQSKIKIANRERVIFKAGEIVGECVQVDYVPLEVVVNAINQIHEPQKVVVPKFVAEWIEYCKSNELTLLGAFDPVSEHGIGLANTFTGEVWKGVDWAKRNQDTFARAWLFGYEVEQEKLYTVEIPDPNADGYSIVLGRKEGKVRIKQVWPTTWKMNCSNQLTEAEIKQDFEWAWQFAKEVE